MVSTRDMAINYLYLLFQAHSMTINTLTASRSKITTIVTAPRSWLKSQAQPVWNGDHGSTQIHICTMTSIPNAEVPTQTIYLFLD